MTEGKCEAKTPEMWKNGDWLLHHDNAPAHNLVRCEGIPDKK